MFFLLMLLQEFFCKNSSCLTVKIFGPTTRRLGLLTSRTESRLTVGQSSTHSFTHDRNARLQEYEQQVVQEDYDYGVAYRYALYF